MAFLKTLLGIAFPPDISREFSEKRVERRITTNRMFEEQMREYARKVEKRQFFFQK